ncbi:MAG: hypothetical protein AB8H80_03815 [Planctomycetota bacterium]
MNKTTKKVDAQAAEEKASPEDYAKISKKQARVKELMRRLAVKLGKENDVEEGR